MIKANRVVRWLNELQKTGATAWAVMPIPLPQVQRGWIINSQLSRPMLGLSVGFFVARFKARDLLFHFSDGISHLNVSQWQTGAVDAD